VHAYLNENRALSTTVRRRRDGHAAGLAHAAAAATAKGPMEPKRTDQAGQPREQVN
jgi:hypothetical protein